MRGLERIALVALVVLTAASVAVANELVNPGFEDGPTGGGAASWGAFGNVYTEAANPPQFVPYQGNQLASMFGNWWGVFNVSGIFQQFATVPGDAWTLSAKSRHWSGDPMVGLGAPNDNWVVQKIAWFDAGGAEIGGVESTILDGTFATDVWHDNAPIVGVAPAGAASMQALILYLQPLWGGGAAHIDNVELIKDGGTPVEATSWGRVKCLFR